VVEGVGNAALVIDYNTVMIIVLIPILIDIKYSLRVNIIKFPPPYELTKLRPWFKTLITVRSTYSRTSHLSELCTCHL